MFLFSNKDCLGGVFFRRGDRCFTSSTRWGNASASWGERYRFCQLFFFAAKKNPSFDIRQWWKVYQDLPVVIDFFLLNTASQIPKSLTVPSGVGFCLSAACWCWVIMENWRLRVFVSRVKGCSNVHMAVKSLLLVNWHIHAFSWVFEKQSSWITTQCHHDMYIPANNQRCPFLTSR